MIIIAFSTLMKQLQLLHHSTLISLLRSIFACEQAANSAPLNSCLATQVLPILPHVALLLPS
jgi:hypothetical protein